MTENLVIGKKYRILTDTENDVWDRVSFWTKASDVELDDGETLQQYLNQLFKVDISTESPELYGAHIDIYDSTPTKVSMTAFSNQGHAVFQTGTPDTYTFTVTYEEGGVEKTVSKSLVLVDEGVTPLVINLIPNGSTATPVGDVQKLLQCANIWDRTYYTTIAQVIADETVLEAVIIDNNSANYLARSTTWATDFCSSETAMTYLGADDYASDLLVANQTWCTAICASAYFTKVLSTHIPTMTSNTTPSGVASADTARSPFLAYAAFNKNAGRLDFWESADNATSSLYYEFPYPVLVKKVYMVPDAYDNWAKSDAYHYIDGWNGSSWVNIGGWYVSASSSASGRYYDTIGNTTKYAKYRLRFSTFTGKDHESPYYTHTCCTELDLWGRL